MSVTVRAWLQEAVYKNSRTSTPHYHTLVDYLRRRFPTLLFSSPLLWIKSTEEAPPTRAESLGHQPRQAAGDLGPGEVVVVEALDGRDDKRASHPSVLCCISHRPSVRRCPFRCWRLSQEELLLNADDIPSRGIQRSKKNKKNPFLLIREMGYIFWWGKL